MPLLELNAWPLSCKTTQLTTEPHHQHDSRRLKDDIETTLLPRYVENEEPKKNKIIWKETFGWEKTFRLENKEFEN